MEDFKYFFIDLYDMVIKIVIVCFKVVSSLLFQFKYVSLAILLFLILRMISTVYRKNKLKDKNRNVIKIDENEQVIDLYGEQETKTILEKVPGTKRILTNLFLNGKNGIDLLMIHETGFYIFETKDYQGSIYGNESDKYWINKKADESKIQFLNPLVQNYNNIEEIKRYLYNPERFSYKSYVVFNEKAELKKVEFDHTKNRVLNRIRLFGSLGVDIEVSQKIFTDEQIDYIANVLEKCNKET